MGVGSDVIITTKGLTIRGSGAYHGTAPGDGKYTTLTALASGIHLLRFQGCAAARIFGVYFEGKDPNNTDIASGADSGIYIESTGGEGDYVIRDCRFWHAGRRAEWDCVRISDPNNNSNCENITVERCTMFGSGSTNPWDETAAERGCGIHIHNNGNAVLIRARECWFYDCRVGFWGDAVAGSWLLESNHFTWCTYDWWFKNSFNPSRVRGCRSEGARHLFRVDSGQVSIKDCQWAGDGSLVNSGLGRPATHLFEIGGDCRLQMEGNALSAFGVGDSDYLMFRKPDGTLPQVQLFMRNNQWPHQDYVKFGVNSSMKLDTNDWQVQFRHGFEGDAGPNPENYTDSGLFALVQNGAAYAIVNLLGWCENQGVINLGTANKPLKIWSKVSGHVLPSADAVANLGDGTHRWALLRAVTVTPGDLILSDRETGEELYKIHEHARDGVFFDDYKTGKRLMRLDRDGNLHLAGKVKENS